MVYIFRVIFHFFPNFSPGFRNSYVDTAGVIGGKPQVFTPDAITSLFLLKLREVSLYFFTQGEQLNMCSTGYRF